MSAEPRSTTSTTEPPDLLAQIASELADLQPERNAYGVKVAGLHLTYGRHPGGAVTKAVILINTGYQWRGRSTRRFTQVDPRYLAQQVRRILREQAEAKERLAAYRSEQAARDEREKAESADIDARVQAAGRKVHKWEVEEVERDGVRLYLYELQLRGLSSLQVRAVLAFLSEIEVTR